MKKILVFLICCVWLPIVWAERGVTEPERREQYAMIAEINHPTLAYRAAVMQKMLEEANYFPSA
jgi:hypothetical protein